MESMYVDYFHDEAGRSQSIHGTNTPAMRLEHSLYDANVIGTEHNQFESAGCVATHASNISDDYYNPKNNFSKIQSMP